MQKITLLEVLTAKPKKKKLQILGEGFADFYRFVKGVIY